MCVICEKWEKGGLSSQDAFKAIGEAMTPKTQKHLEDLSEKILSREVPLPSVNQKVDEDFWRSTHRDDSDD